MVVSRWGLGLWFGGWEVGSMIVQLSIWSGAYISATVYS